MREGHVTGVQTCALPIAPLMGQVPGQHHLRGGGAMSGGDAGDHGVVEEVGLALAERARSEERRVGKEGGSRCSAMRNWIPRRGRDNLDGYEEPASSGEAA